MKVELSVLYKEEYKLAGRMLIKKLLRCVYVTSVKYSCRLSNIKNIANFFSRAQSTKIKVCLQVVCDYQLWSKKLSDGTQFIQQPEVHLVDLTTFF